MAKKSKLENNNLKAELAARFKEKRNALLAVIKDPAATMEEKLEAYRKFSRIPRNASPIRYRNRCGVTGRPRGYLRKFNMSRVSFRELSLEGKIPGVTKSSW